MSALLAFGLTACGSDDQAPDALEAQALDAATSHSQLSPGEAGTVQIEGPRSGEIVATETGFEVRLDGVELPLVVTPIDGELSLGWGGEMVDPEAELPSDVADAVARVRELFEVPGLIDHLFEDQPELAAELAFPKPIFKQCMVTGCSGQICAPKPVFTTCEWRPEYACYSLSTCGAFGPGFTCGWKQTPEFLACLDSHGASGDGDGDGDGDTGSCGCETDADCVKTVPGCCPCNSGGKEIAVAKQCLGEVEGCDIQGPIACPHVYMCTGAEAVCDAGECVLSGGGIKF